MNTLLVIHSSGRTTRSITRKLTRRFVEVWKDELPHATVIERDVGTAPVSSVTEAWIAAAFSGPEARTPAMHAALGESERLVGELIAADAIVLGAPMYNFGMPAQLKAWFDQIVRVGRTFAIDEAAENPYRPLLASKPCVVITSASDAELYPGGALARFNHLEPHLNLLLEFVGIAGAKFVRVVAEGDPSQRAAALAAAGESVADLARQFVSGGAAEPGGDSRGGPAALVRA